MNEPVLAGLLTEHARALGIPGAALGVLRDGSATFAWYGVEDLRSGAPVGLSTRFSAGSLTKSMVASVIARLADQGRMSLDDAVADRVPELRGAAWAEAATVRDLLANRSQLPLRYALEFDFAYSEPHDDALSRFAARVAAEEPTSVAWSYTNAGYALLGRVIETVTGSVWEDGMRAELLRPAGMTGTEFATQGVTVARVTGHDVTADGAMPVEPATSRALGPAGTTLVATLPDILLFAGRLLDDLDLAVLRAPGADVRIHAWLDGWCHGLASFAWPGAAVWGWDSLIDGERGVLRLIPERRIAVALATNGSNGRALYRAVFPVLMQSLAGIEVPSLCTDATAGAAGDLSRYAGVYAWPDREARVSVAGERLMIVTGGRERSASPINERVFVVDADDPDNPTVTFGAFDADGRPQVLYLMLWGLPRVA